MAQLQLSDRPFKPRRQGRASSVVRGRRNLPSRGHLALSPRKCNSNLCTMGPIAASAGRRTSRGLALNACSASVSTSTRIRHGASRFRAFQLTSPDHDLVAYDRCEACMAAPRAWAAHDRAHHFFPVIHPGDLGDYHIVKTGAPAGPIHHGITCDGCKQNIVGAWHRCLVCDGVYSTWSTGSVDTEC